MNYDSISHLIPGIRRYVDMGVPTGDFLHAVLSNDLREAFGRADDQNRYLMFEIVSYCYNKIPSACWGSPETVKAWLKTKAEERTVQQQELQHREQPEQA